MSRYDSTGVVWPLNAIAHFQEYALSSRKSKGNSYVSYMPTPEVPFLN